MAQRSSRSSRERASHNYFISDTGKFSRFLEAATQRAWDSLSGPDSPFYEFGKSLSFFRSRWTPLGTCRERKEEEEEVGWDQQKPFSVEGWSRPDRLRHSRLQFCRPLRK